jgi:hypothetical protein
MARKTNDKTVNVGAVNNCQHFWRWGYIEISDPWDAKQTIRDFMKWQVL